MPHSGPFRALAAVLLLGTLSSAVDSIADETREADRVAALVDATEAEDRAETARLALFELRDLGPAGDAGVLELLASSSPRIRRAALLEIHQRHLAERQDPGSDVAVFLPALRDAAIADAEPGNADLAAVLVARIEATALDDADAIARLERVDEENRFRSLALLALAERHARSGRHDAAENARLAAARHEAKVEPAADASRAAYWECRDRADLREMRALLSYHEQIERVDARLYGLPENDFDDQKNLTIPERLYLRAWSSAGGADWPTEGQIQYPREIRHLLRKHLAAEGKIVDCSGLLAEVPAAPAKILAEDGTEVKAQEDTGLDNEVNVAVNPYDPRFLIATSNDYGGGSGNDLYRSSDRGSTWIGGDVSIADNCCDPVTYYNRTDVDGTPTDVAYHSTLVFEGFGVKSRVLYSTDNGASWNDCGVSIGTSSRDRQDHAIDTNPASACYNTIYLAHHNGTQFVAASTGSTFPYCQSWNEQSTGVSGTIGSAIVISTNGTAHNFFTQYRPGGLFHTRTTNCGDSWSTATEIAEVTNGGDFEWGIPSTCSRQVYRYPQADSDRQALSAFRNNIYVVWNDLSGDCSPPGCNGNTTCNNDIYLLVGTPNDRVNPTSWTWEKTNLTDGFSDDFTDEFYPGLTVDPADGSIYVSYYRSESGAGGITPRKTQVHYVMTRSIDGGETWEEPYRITDQPTNESGAGADLSLQWGDYTWNDVIDGVAYGAWTDRREGLDEDIWVGRVCSEPAHWSERAPSFLPPATLATSPDDTNWTVTWNLPDLYWGDGDHNPGGRKIELFVDGVLEETLAASATSTTWSAPDAADHELRIRATNGCGIAKDYAWFSVPDGTSGLDLLFADDFESGDLSAWSP